MRSFARSLLVLPILLTMLAFRPAPTPAPLALVAQGDSLTGVVTFSKQGTPDSVVATYTAPNVATIRHKLTTGTADTALIVPSPFLSPGASLTVTVTLTPYNGGNAGTPKSTTASYTKPAGLTIIGFNLTSP